MNKPRQEVMYDVRKGADIYRKISCARLEKWILTGRIKRGDALVWRSGLSGWRGPDELEEFESAFQKAGDRKKDKKDKRPNVTKSNIRKILIADDEEDLCFLLSNCLSKRGFSVASVNTARDVLGCVGAQAPDLLLLDLRFPDGEGTDVLLDVKREYPELVVDIISAYGSGERKEKAAVQGADGFIDKPFTEKDILAAIARHNPKGTSS